MDEFETRDPALRGEMTITMTLADRDGGTDLLAVHEGLPPGVSPADNEVGWQVALAKLAAVVETGWHVGGYGAKGHSDRDCAPAASPVA